MNPQLFADMHVSFASLLASGQLVMIGGGLLLWLLLRVSLPDGSQYALHQTLTFFLLCLFGEVSAGLMALIQWDNVALGFFEISMIGVGIALIRFFGLFAFRVVLPRLHLNAPRILEDITVFVCYGVWLIIRLRLMGLDLSHIVATSAVITAIVAFSMQDTLGNILGGLAVHLDHSVEIGDWLVMDGISGKVTDIRWRYTKIITRNGEKVVVPNSLLMKNRFSVVGSSASSGNAWRRWVWFNVGVDHAPGRVRDIVENTVRGAQIANVARDPAPNVVIMEFGSGYLRYALRYWLTEPALDDPTDSEVRHHVFNALMRNGMSLALPEEVRHMVKENQSHDDLLAQRELQRRIAALANVDLFRDLTDSERQTLAAHLTHSPFARGDVITRQGATAHWLYIIVSGQADVWLEGEGGERRLLSQLHDGDVFGEMGLMTGEPRRATVTAASDVECYRLDKVGLAAVMQGRPAIAEEISRVLSERDTELQKLRHELEASALARRDHAPRESVLERIREFFKLPG